MYRLNSLFCLSLGIENSGSFVRISSGLESSDDGVKWVLENEFMNGKKVVTVTIVYGCADPAEIEVTGRREPWQGSAILGVDHEKALLSHGKLCLDNVVPSFTIIRWNASQMKCCEW